MANAKWNLVPLISSLSRPTVFPSRLLLSKPLCIRSASQSFCSVSAAEKLLCCQLSSRPTWAARWPCRSPACPEPWEEAVAAQSGAATPGLPPGIAGLPAVASNWKNGGWERDDGKREEEVCVQGKYVRGLEYLRVQAHKNDLCSVWIRGETTANVGLSVDSGEEARQNRARTRQPFSRRSPRHGRCSDCSPDQREWLCTSLPHPTSLEQNLLP